MMKILIICFFFSFSSYSKFLSKSQKRPKTVSTVKNIVKKVKKKSVISHLRKFVRCCSPNRMVGSNGHNKVSSYLVREIQKIDSEGKNLLFVDKFTPNLKLAISNLERNFYKEVKSKLKPESVDYKKFKAFRDHRVSALKSVEGIKGRNVIWEKKGYLDANKVIIIGAHYDSLAYDKKTFVIDKKGTYQAADKNASGVSIALSLIEILSEVDLAKTVRIIFFDFEELGQLGSVAYLNKYKDSLKKEEVFGFISLDRLGHDSKSRDLEKRFGNMRSYIRGENQPGHGKDLHFSRTFLQNTKKLGFGVSFNSISNGNESSSHKSFWKEGFPAMLMSQNLEADSNEKNHHTSNDFVESLNFRTLYKSYLFLSGSIITWAYDIF